jgi:hypothetical protein
MDFWVGVHRGGLTGRIIGQRTRDPPTGRDLGAKICGMSGDSHRRMLSWLLDVEWEHLQGHFVTLTYADTGELGNAEVWHRQLATFWAGRQRDGATGMVWKLEMLVRKSGSQAGAMRPHWHTLVLGLQESTELVAREIRAHWSRICRQDTITHVATYHEEKGRRAAMLYLAKYMSKVTASKDHPATGRVWGWMGEVPRSVPSFESIDPAEWKYLVASIRLSGGGEEGSRYIKALSPWQSAWTAVGAGPQILEGIKRRNIEEMT